MKDCLAFDCMRFSRAEHYQSAGRTTVRMLANARAIMLTELDPEGVFRVPHKMKVCKKAAMTASRMLWATIALIGVSLCHAESVAITFDDLPLNSTLAPGMTQTQIAKDVLAILKARRVPQVYGFINAGKLEANADGAQALKLWVAGGERVGNHTYLHLDLHKNMVDDFLKEVRLDEPALELLDSSQSWRWLRYPYLREGDTLEKRQAVRAQLLERGYRIAQVTLDYEDYLWNGAYARCFARDDKKAIAWLRSSYLSTASHYLDVDRQMAQLVFGREISHVLLLHLGAFSSTILPDLFDLLKRKGFTLVTLETAQSDPAYDTDPNAGSKFGGTLLEQWMDARALKYPTIEKKPYKELEAICN
jgi:peptidoglycan-N-acetylglucosamine deacetylase